MRRRTSQTSPVTSVLGLQSAGSERKMARWKCTMLNLRRWRQGTSSAEVHWHENRESTAVQLADEALVLAVVRERDTITRLRHGAIHCGGFLQSPVTCSASPVRLHDASLFHHCGCTPTLFRETVLRRRSSLRRRCVVAPFRMKVLVTRTPLSRMPFLFEDLGLSIIAGSLRRAGYSCRFFDAPARCRTRRVRPAGLSERSGAGALRGHSRGDSSRRDPAPSGCSEAEGSRQNRHHRWPSMHAIDEAAFESIQSLLPS